MTSPNSAFRACPGLPWEILVTAIILILLLSSCKTKQATVTDTAIKTRSISSSNFIIDYTDTLTILEAMPPIGGKLSPNQTNDTPRIAPRRVIRSGRRELTTVTADSATTTQRTTSAIFDPDDYTIPGLKPSTSHLGKYYTIALAIVAVLIICRIARKL